MSTWPATIPLLKEGYKESPPDRVLRSNMGVGPAKLRRRSSSAVRNVSIKLFLTDEQIEILDAFYLVNDVSAFDFENPRTSETIRARFTSNPPYEINEKYWNVGVDLEILP